MISVRSFGKTPEGTEAQLFILDNGKMSVYITDFGGHIVAINVPDKDGVLTDVVLGADNVKAYADGIGYMGATVGRFANRIEKGKFELNGKEYTLAVNNGPNHLHGGIVGFNNKMFDAFVDGDTLKLSLLSPDGEEGFPGNLKFEVSFTLCHDNSLSIEYNAVSDKDTVVNFTNHAYFNLNGAITEKTVYNHSLQINAEAFCRGDKDCLADGTIVPVRNTDMDFRSFASLDERLHSDYEDIAMTGGIDHNFVLSMQKGEFKEVAKLYCEDTGILLECFTDQPGIQVYTGIGTDYKNGKGGAYYGKHSAVCLETQNFPNATSFSYFPSPVLRAGDNFYSKTVYKFSVK
ncbi:MAG: aldose epimerase family protein [Acutalibacteraceae bacterium]|nr:aldose epimerase family protein [Acutalibacteraceae bacterium]